MADLHSTPDITVSGTERRLLVGYRPNGRDISTPSLPFLASGYAKRDSVPGSRSRLR